jgi:hypothetical protein
MMSLTDLASLGSFVSAIAVLISLIYLSLQVKQAERNQQSSIRATRVTRIVDIYMRLAEPSLSDAVVKASAGAADVTDAQIRQFSFYCGARFYNAEDSFNQYQEGLLNQRAFDSLVVGLKNSLSQPGMRAYYKRQRDAFGKEFAEFVDKLLVETPLVHSPDAAAQWRADVAAELASS